jgi:putative component of membrane protein insertase Oxa1/YidC/SpoIIIJ protein YidD
VLRCNPFGGGGVDRVADRVLDAPVTGETYDAVSHEASNQKARV